MFQNPRRGRQARNFTTNVPKILDLKSSSEQIFSENLRLVPLNLSCCKAKHIFSTLHWKKGRFSPRTCLSGKFVLITWSASGSKLPYYGLKIQASADVNVYRNSLRPVSNVVVLTFKAGSNSARL